MKGLYNDKKYGGHIMKSVKLALAGTSGLFALLLSSCGVLGNPFENSSPAQPTQPSSSGFVPPTSVTTDDRPALSTSPDDPGAFEGLSVEYNHEYGGMVITSYSHFDKPDLEVPEKLCGKDVVGIGDSAFAEHAELERISLPPTIRFIGDHAFSNCTGLHDFALPRSLENIYKFAFENCKAFNKIWITSSVSFIGDYAFAGCYNLYCVEVDPSNPNYDSRNNCNAIIDSRSDILQAGCQTTIIPDGLKVIAPGAFYNIETLDEISLPAGLVEIGSDAFFACVNLFSILVPESVVYIGSAAFAGCYNIAICCLNDELYSTVSDWNPDGYPAGPETLEDISFAARFFNPVDYSIYESDNYPILDIRLKHPGVDMNVFDEIEWVVDLFKIDGSATHVIGEHSTFIESTEMAACLFNLADTPFGTYVIRFGGNTNPYLKPLKLPALPLQLVLDQKAYTIVSGEAPELDGVIGLKVEAA